MLRVRRDTLRGVAFAWIKVIQVRLKCGWPVVIDERTLTTHFNTGRVQLLAGEGSREPGEYVFAQTAEHLLIVSIDRGVFHIFTK